MEVVFHVGGVFFRRFGSMPLRKKVMKFFDEKGF